MKYKIFGLGLILLIIIMSVLIFWPKQKDFPHSTFSLTKVENLFIHNLNDTLDLVITDSSEIRKVTDQLQKMKVGDYFNAKGGSYSFDFDVNFKNNEKKEFRLYHNKLYGTYISGNYDYKNDSVEVVLMSLIRRFGEPKK